MKKFGGNVLFLDKRDINTDEIIPAKYLTEISKEALAPFCMEDLKLEGFEPKRDVPGKAAIVARANFGCGSSREHAPWALEANGINLVIASSFARIFRQNMYNCGMLAVELAAPELDEIFGRFARTPTEVDIDIDARIMSFRSAGATGATKTCCFRLKEFEKALVRSGGWVEYAASKY